MANDGKATSGPQRMRRRPNAIGTERRFDANPAAAHMAAQRERRTRKGDLFLRRCVVLFLLSLVGVMKTPQYSIPYYCCWVITYMSFFLMLPSVLPTDNTRIQVMLCVTCWNMGCASLIAARFAVRKPEPLNVAFWSSHACLAGVFCVVAAHAAARLAPAHGLHKFWRCTGYYFQLVSLVTLMDFLVAYSTGKYHRPEFRVAFFGNLTVIAEQFAIGRLCHSHRFKNLMWTYAAQIASIRVRDNTRSRAALWRWLVCSAVLSFALALFATTRQPPLLSRRS